MIKGVSGLVVGKLAFCTRLSLHKPILKCKVDNIEFIIHITSRYSKQKELMIDDKGRALFTDGIAIYG